MKDKQDIAACSCSVLAFNRNSCQGLAQAEFHVKNLYERISEILSMSIAQVRKGEERRAHG